MNRTLAAAALLSAAIVPLAACSAQGGRQPDGVAPQGTGGERRYPVKDFDAVALGGSGDVDVRIGAGYAVVATGSPEALDRIVVYTQGRTLHLEQKRGVRMPVGTRIRYAVTMPRIGAASIGGSGSIAVDRIEGADFQGSIGGSGRLDLRGLRVDKASFAIGGSGDVTAVGRARSSEVSIGGSGRIHNAALATEHSEISIAGAGNVEANATRTADVTIVGSGDVTVTGGAKCSVTKMGGGRVNCR